MCAYTNASSILHVTNNIYVRTLWRTSLHNNFIVRLVFVGRMPVYVLLLFQ